LALYIVELPRSTDKGAQNKERLNLHFSGRQMEEMVRNVLPCPILLRDGNLPQQAPESYCFEESGKHHRTFSWQKGKNHMKTDQNNFWPQ
jgi:hypothetical protein